MRCLYVLGLAAVLLSSFAFVAAAAAQCPGGGTGQWALSPGQRYAGPLSGGNAILLADPDGAGPLPVVMIVGGSFYAAGAISARSIAAWNGGDWITFGDGVNGFVNALAVFNGEVYAAGLFASSGQTSCNNIARWNAAAGGGAGAWQPLGAGLTGNVPNAINPHVNAMAVYNGRLYVAGQFATAGGIPANSIASWDGTSWQALGTAISGGGVGRAFAPEYLDASVNALAVFNGLLYVGGRFDRVNGQAEMDTLATWNGSSWGFGATIGNTDVNSYPQVLALASAASTTTVNAWLYAGGDFTSFNGTPTNNVATISKTVSGVGSWAAMGAGLGGPADKLYIDMGANSPSAILADSYEPYAFHPNPNKGINRFAAGAWSQLAPDRANALGKFNGQYVAGVWATDSAEFFFGRRVGSEWQVYGNGLSNQPRSVFPGPGGTDLYAAGNMSIADQQPVGGIARLDSAGAWHPVGTSPFIRVKSAVANATDLFAIGQTSPNVYGLRRFTSGAWTTVSGGDLGGQAVLRNIGTDVYLLGTNLYKWDGAAFAQVGPALPSTVYEVVVLQGVLRVLLAGGMYDTLGGVWNFERTYRGGSPAFIHGATVFNNRLFVSSLGATDGGIDELVGNTWINRGHFFLYSFAEVNGTLYGLHYNYLYRLDGDTLVPVVSPFTGQSLAVHNGNLIIGGTQFEAQSASPVFARLVCCAADSDGNGSLAVADIFAFLNAWFAGAPSADFDGVNGLQVADIFAFLNAWFAGC